MSAHGQVGGEGVGRRGLSGRLRGAWIGGWSGRGRRSCPWSVSSLSQLSSFWVCHLSLHLFLVVSLLLFFREREEDGVENGPEFVSRELLLCLD